MKNTGWMWHYCGTLSFRWVLWFSWSICFCVEPGWRGWVVFSIMLCRFWSICLSITGLKKSSFTPIRSATLKHWDFVNMDNSSPEVKYIFYSNHTDNSLSFFGGDCFFHQCKYYKLGLFRGLFVLSCDFLSYFKALLGGALKYVKSRHHVTFVFCLLLRVSSFLCL